ncbi:hypothetical protein K8R15_24645 [Escherichia coli]
MKVILQELATATSMTENGHRRDMHPARQIAGFRAMAQEGKHLRRLATCWAIHLRRPANAETGRPCTRKSSLDALAKTASPPNTVRRWRWRTTPRVRYRCLNRLPVRMGR